MAIANEQNNLERLSCRIPPHIKDLIEKAASIRGQSITAFTSSVLAQEAEAIVANNEIICLNNAARDNFLAKLDEEQEINERLQSALRLHSEKVVE